MLEPKVSFCGKSEGILMTSLDSSCPIVFVSFAILQKVNCSVIVQKDITRHEINGQQV